MPQLFVLLRISPFLLLAAASGALAQSQSYELYRKYVAEKNWIGARNLGNAIVRNYPNSQEAKNVAAELPDITAKGDEAQKQLEQRRAVEDKNKAKRDAERQALQKKGLAGLRKER